MLGRDLDSDKAEQAGSGFRLVVSPGHEAMIDELAIELRDDLPGTWDDRRKLVLHAALTRGLAALREGR